MVQVSGHGKPVRTMPGSSNVPATGGGCQRRVQFNWHPACRLRVAASPISTARLVTVVGPAVGPTTPSAETPTPHHATIHVELVLRGGLAVASGIVTGSLICQSPPLPSPPSAPSAGLVEPS